MGPEIIMGVLFTCILILALINSRRVSRWVFRGLRKFGKGWAVAGAIVSFGLTFAVFAIAMSAVMSMVFWR